MVDLKTKKKKAFRRWKCKKCYAYYIKGGLDKCSALLLNKPRKTDCLQFSFDDKKCRFFKPKTKFKKKLEMEGKV